MRTVITGSPGALYQLQAADLPVDLNLAHSFWRWVDLSGFNLSAYDMTDMDVLDCNGSAVVLPSNGKVRFLMSRRTNWAGAVLPADISSYNADFVVENYRQAANRTNASIRLVRDYVAANYSRSWQDGIQRLVDAGVTLAQMRTRFNTAFAGKQKLLDRMNYHLDRRIWSPNVPQWKKTRFQGVLDGVDIDLEPHTIARLDRWATARMLEQYVATLGHTVGCYINQLDPYPVLRFVSELDMIDPDWWVAFGAD